MEITPRPVFWQADFVSPSTWAPTDGPRPAYLLRAEFEVPPTAVSVTVFVTAHGIYDVEVDGERATRAELAPGWSSYAHRLRYQTLDLTTAAPPGRHALGVWLGDGWYRGRIGCDGGLWDVYGSDVSVLAQVEVAHDDGRVAVLPLTWRWAPSPITAAGLYEGETYDARLEQVGWSRPGFDDSAWATPTVLPRVSFPHVFEAPIGPGVEVIEALRPVAVERRPDGRVRLDFGQNTSGKIRISGVVAPAGHTLRLHHTEVLEADGTLGTRPLRSATAIDTYTFGEGNTPITWTPRFTIHGFRYAELEGWPEGFDPAEHVELLVVHSVMERSGHFASSHELLNEFHRNVVWGMRGNFVDLPTDCPQRDERLGWTGDIAVFAPAAVFLYNSTSFLLNWLRDVKAEQRADGTMRNYHPFVDWGFPPMPSAAWGDAAVLVPWALYRHTGRLDILADHVESMSAWIDQVDAITGHTGHWSSGFTLGDWLDPGAPPEQPSASLTDKYLVATAYYARSARLTAEAWRLLGDESQAARYGALATQALDAFRRNYVTPAGRLVSDTVTSYALAICFDLLTPEQFPVAGARLAELVADKDHN
ncbi:MAG: family 78 glycoside hydrolase catalytic domain, partial [Promicromonosporaceae bacterium]|nr:family 78 glycoside hydrolase catalytic domain [Promicromonosporaceae bacterium]